jgi:hypothetical protein
MKATSLKTAALLAGTIGLLAGNATAQATTGVVGYNTWDIDPGFNFVGVTLHENPLASGTLESATANSVTDDDVDLGALIASGTYILEIEDGSGIIQEITAAGAGTSITTPSDLSGLGFPVAYTLRQASTVALVFGPANESGLAAGSFGAAGADVIKLWNGGGFDDYYYDNFAPPGFASGGWVNLNTATAADATALNLIYADSFVISSASGNDVVVTGDLKSGATEVNKITGFNFVGAVAPVGASLATAYGVANTGGLAAGSFGAAGADVIWIWNGGGFNKYYYDNFAPPGFASGGWVNLDTSTAADSTTVLLDSSASGYVIDGVDGNAVQGVPAYYVGL